MSDRVVNVSNPDKVMYPDTGFTKAQVVAYYEMIGPTMLTHVAGRPLTLHRFPNGVEGNDFYEKNCPSHRPEWVNVVDNPVKSKVLHQCTAENVETLMWLGNLASLEIHPGLSIAHDLETPTKLTFDLDPGEPATIVECCQVALTLKGMFEQMGLVALAKTSGSKGLHVDVPLNAPCTFEATKSFANAIARLLQTHQPDAVVADMAKAVRTNKVFVDWSQNDRVKTTVAPYSLRARRRPWVSTPLTWDEVSEAAALPPSRDVLRFEANDIARRLATHGDLFAPMATTQQSLPKLG